MNSIFDSYLPHQCTISTAGEANPADDGETRVGQVSTVSRCHFIAESRLFLKLDGTYGVSKGVLLLPATVALPNPTDIITINGVNYRPRSGEALTNPFGQVARQVVYLE